MKNINNTKKYSVIFSVIALAMIVSSILPSFAKADYLVYDGSYSGGALGYDTYNYSNYNGGFNNNNYQLSGSCSAGVSNTAVGGTVTWTGSASGGNGFYTYYWTGDEGISATGQYITKVYSYSGAKNVTLTIQSNGQSITRTCSVNVASGNQVLSAVQKNNIPLEASVLLSDVPYTGAGDVFRVASFILGLILWSLFVTYLVLKRKFNTREVVTVNAVNSELKNDNADKTIGAFSRAVETERKEIESVEDYARANKVLLSNDAVSKVIKLSKLGKANATELIRKMAGSDWVSVGEGEVESYI